MHHMVAAAALRVLLWVLSKKPRRNGSFKLCEFLWLLFNTTWIKLHHLLVCSSIKVETFFKSPPEIAQNFTGSIHSIQIRISLWFQESPFLALSVSKTHLGRTCLILWVTLIAHARHTQHFFKHIFPSPESFFGVLAESKWLKREIHARGELLCYCAYCPLKTIDRGDERQYSNLLFFIFKKRTHSARGVLFLSWSVDAGELCFSRHALFL